MEISAEDKVRELAKLVGISQHPDLSVTLRALKKLINQPSTPIKTEEQRLNLNSCSLGAASNENKKVKDAVRTLRLLHVARQRKLQTEINEILSNIQKITGDPKANLKIGRVGR